MAAFSTMTLVDARSKPSFANSSSALFRIRSCLAGSIFEKESFVFPPYPDGVTQGNTPIISPLTTLVNPFVWKGASGENTSALLFRRDAISPRSITRPCTSLARLARDHAREALRVVLAVREGRRSRFCDSLPKERTTAGLLSLFWEISRLFQLLRILQQLQPDANFGECCLDLNCCKKRNSCS